MKPGPFHCRSRSRPRGVVFDLDGTLIDSRVDIANACNEALTAVGRAALPVNVVATFVGDGARVLVARALAAPPDAPLVDEALSYFRAAYEAKPVVATTLMPGAERCLTSLAGAKVALATNKPRRATELVLAGLGIAARFAAIAAGGDAPLKPAPDLLLKVLGEIELEAEDVWMVGDSPQDVLAARAVGAMSIAVMGFVAREQLSASRPDVMIESLEEVLDLWDQSCALSP